MRQLLAAVLVLVLASGALGGIEGSTVSLIEPWTVPDPLVQTTFRFYVQCTASDSYVITGVIIGFHNQYTLLDDTMGWDPGPNWEDSVGTWEMWTGSAPGLHEAYWAFGELVDGEDFYIHIDAMNDPDKRDDMGIINWTLVGNAPGQDPDEVTGVIDMSASPMEFDTWGAIKSLYR